MPRNDNAVNDESPLVTDPDVLAQIRKRVASWPIPGPAQLDLVAVLRPEHRRAYGTARKMDGDHAA